MIAKGSNHHGRGARRPPSDDLDEEAMELDDEKPCLLMELKEEFDMASVEDQFLGNLEEKCWEGRDEVDMESLVREAEVEMAKAAQLLKSKVVAALIEREEFEELKKKKKKKKTWRFDENSSSGCYEGVGFGSPM